MRIRIRRCVNPNRHCVFLCTWYRVSYTSLALDALRTPPAPCTVTEFCAPNSAPISVFREFGRIRHRKSWDPAETAALPALVARASLVSGALLSSKWSLVVSFFGRHQAHSKGSTSEGRLRRKYQQHHGRRGGRQRGGMNPRRKTAKCGGLASDVAMVSSCVNE